MKNISIQAATIALLGLFAGGCITVAFILVLFWHSLSPSELMQWFHDNGPRVAIVMLPMQIIPFLFSIYIYLSLKKSNDTTKNLWLWVNASNIIILVMLLVYFLPVNVALVNQTMEHNNVLAELARWEMIHKVRTGLTVLSTVLAVVAYAMQVKNAVRLRTKK